MDIFDRHIVLIRTSRMLNQGLSLKLRMFTEEVPTVCWCGRRAQYNARVKDGKIVRTGEQVLLGGNDTYVSLCRKHFKEGSKKRYVNKEFQHVMELKLKRE